MHVGLTPGYLSTAFKRETGKTLSEYIKIERIHFAMSLLTQTDLPISVISGQVGYESVAYFSAVFRQQADCSPSEFRKRAKSG